MPERSGVAWRGPHNGDDEPVDVPRYVAALKRAWPLIALIVASMTVTVLALSLVLPETYRATAKIVMDDRAEGLEPSDVETVKRRLATVRALLTTRAVRQRAARSLPGETPETLEDKVEPSVDRDANIIDIAATDGDPNGAAAIANAVARSFLAMQRAAERARLARARTQLLQALDRLRASPVSDAQVQAIQERLSQVSVSEASAGTELQLAQPARPPEDPDSPRPVRNTIFAFFASIFIAVLAALAIDHLAPRIAGPRELGRLTGVPILAALPAARPATRDAQVRANETYQALQSSLELQMPAARKVVLVAGALADDGASTVAIHLADETAQAGFETLLVSADLRGPPATELLGGARSPGLTELVAGLQDDGGAAEARLAEAIQRAPTSHGVPQLHILPSGSRVANPTALLTGPALSSLFEELRRSQYRFVLVHGPPMLTGIDGHLLARQVDGVLAVCRYDRMSPARAVELGDILHGLHAPVLGIVALGGRDFVPSLFGVPPRPLPTRARRRAPERR
jgi:Mrp family chromosome partitioning ATPase/capsular polysaccharide biosynthesis protein